MRTLKSEPWKSDIKLHEQAIAKFLRGHFHIKPGSEDHQLASDVAVQLSIALNRKTGPEYSDLEAPSLWKLKQSHAQAKLAFKIGRFVRDKVKDGNPSDAIQSYLNTALELNLPTKFSERPFYQQTFVTKEGEWSGRQLLHVIGTQEKAGPPGR